jgi:hypothetical protein
MKKVSLVLLFTIFILGIFLRFRYIYPDRIVFGYDQIINVFDARKIVDNHDLIVQQVTPNALGLNHGVLWDYFLSIPYFLGGGNPMFIAYWYAFINAIAIISVFFFSYYLFHSWPAALASSFITAVSYNMILIAGWISNTTVVLYLMPLFFLGFWLYRKGRSWGLPLSSFLLGLFIQSQMLMVYNFATVIVLWLVFKLKRPSLKTTALSLFSFLAAASTMIIVEVRTGFSSLNAILKPTGVLDESSVSFLSRLGLFSKGFLSTFSQNLTSSLSTFGILIAVVIILVIIRYVFNSKLKSEERNALKLLTIFLFCPIFMLFIGYHDKPWTLLGMVPAVFVAFGYVVTKIPSFPPRILVLSLFFYLNMAGFVQGLTKGELFIAQEPSSTLKGQLAVLDYTYRSSNGKEFAINSVNYPLYENTFWSYHYLWYGLKKFGYLPSWSGGDQLYPYNTLQKSSGKEKIFYMITDETGSIPEIYREIGRKWGFKYGKLLEEKLIGGFTVQRFERFN